MSRTRRRDNIFHDRSPSSIRVCGSMRDQSETREVTFPLHKIDSVVHLARRGRQDPGYTRLDQRSGRVRFLLLVLTR